MGAGMPHPPPLKPRSPPRVPRRGMDLHPLLPRSFSQPSFRTASQGELLLDRLQRHRPMRNALLVLLSLVLAANCVWAAQAVAAWRSGTVGAAAEQKLLFERLNSTTLSVEVSRLDGGAADGIAEHSTFLLNAQLVENAPSKGNSTAIQQPPHGSDSAAANASGGGSAGVAGTAAAAAAAAAVESGVEAAENLPTDLLAQLKGMGSALTDALVSAKDSLTHGKHWDGDSKEARQKEEEGGKEAAAEPPPPPPPEHRAVLHMPEVDDRSSDPCAQALGVPKVALLFLTKGELFHHQTWARWFEAARDQLPVRQLRSAACGTQAADFEAVAAPGAEPMPVRDAQHGQRAGREDQRAPAADEQTHRQLRHVKTAWRAARDELMQSVKQQQETERASLAAPVDIAAACGWNASTGQQLPVHHNGSSGPRGSGPIDGQHLFSVYIHAPPEVKDEKLPLMFRGRLIADRLQPEWGTHQLVEATRNLLWEAFRDPLNQWFVLLSESDIPLYDPLTFYQQLMAERKSRMNLCKHAAPTDPRRWTWRLSSKTVKAWHWRKSSQWFGLMRSHVEVVLQDVEVFRKFEVHCRNAYDADYRRWRDCFSDEHYIPTLLASKGLEHESSCNIDGIVAVDWSGGGAHPKSYRSWEVRRGLIQKTRGEDKGCNASHAIADAQAMFVSKQHVFALPRGGDSSNSSSAGATAERSAASVEGGQGRDQPAWQRQLCGSKLAGPLPSFSRPLNQSCSLTARKFPKPTVRAVARIFSDCRSELFLLGPGACPAKP